MVKREVLIVKNISREGPGLLGDILNEIGVKSRIVDLVGGDFFPDAREYSALVVLGGPDSANDQNEKMKTELQRIKEAIEAKIPYLGICLGLQTLVKACGGNVIKSPVKEIGFRGPNKENFKIKLTREGKNDPLFEGLNDSLPVFHLHGETVELTDEMSLLGIGEFCRNQIVRVGENAYGLQCHFELTPSMFEQWISEDPDLLELDRDMLRSDFAKISFEYESVGKQLFRNFLKIAGI